MPPGSKSEAEKKTDWPKMRKAKEWRKEHDEEFYRALRSPRYFGAFMGLEHVYGPPPPEEVKPARSSEVQEAQFESFLEAFTGRKAESIDWWQELKSPREKRV